MDVKYTMMPTNTVLGNDLTVIQACSEALTRAGYEKTRAHDVAAMLYDAVDHVLEQHALRTVLHRVGGPNPLFTMLAEMAKLDAQPKATQVVSIKALARQFAMAIPDQIGNHVIAGFSHRQLLRMKMNPKDPVELQRQMQDLYRINYCQPAEPYHVTNRVLEMEYGGCSVDEIYEAAKVFNKQVETAGSWPAFVAGLVKDAYDIKHIDHSVLEQEAKFPSVPPLVWSEPAKAVEGGSSYDHVIAQTPFGKIVIEWKSWKEYDTYSFSMPFDFNGEPAFHSGNTLEEAKEKAQMWYNYYIRKAFGYNVREPQ